jgi:predicted dehydrogenase
VKTIRWGIVGTGGIANSMAGMIKMAEISEIGAVASRRMETAQAFAKKHDVPNAFDSWQDMIDSNVIDAIYVATPTSVREEICIAAAKGGKHVLGEKPFSSLPSVKRITKACRDNNVAFMDGTHFVHHPRTLHIKENRDDTLGFVWSVASAFQFNLTDRGNIRFNPELEPMGAIGDAGWYNMRAAVEYLPPDVVLDSVSAHLRRDSETGAAISGTGVLDFTDGSSSTWNCGFDSGAVVMDLRITGTEGVINIDDFLGQNRDGSADFLYRKGGWGGGSSEDINIPSNKPGAALMFEDMAAAAGDPSLREQWMTATERTQALLDAVWMEALQREKNHSSGMVSPG